MQTPEAAVDVAQSDSGHRRDATKKRHEGQAMLQSNAGYGRGKTSEGEKLEGVIGMKQGRIGYGRNKASRVRERPKAQHSRLRQGRRRSLPVSANVEEQPNLTGGSSPTRGSFLRRTLEADRIQWNSERELKGMRGYRQGIRFLP